MNREDLAWCAGFFDGEGCSTIQWDKKRPYPRIAVANTNEELILKFQHSTGNLGKIYFDNRTLRGGNRKLIYKYQIVGYEKVQALICMLWPWLGNEKREQAAKMMIQCRTDRNQNPRRSGQRPNPDIFSKNWI